MMLFRLAVALAAAMLLAAPVAAAPLEAYGKLPVIDAATLSPSGQQLALMVTDGDRRSVAVQDLTTKAIKARASFGDTPVQAIRWVGERRLLIITSVDYDPVNVAGGLRDWRRAHVFDLTTLKLTPLHSNAPNGMNNIVGAPIVRTVDGEPMVFVQGIQFVERRGYVALFQANLDTGRSQVVRAADEGTRRWLVGIDGQPVAEEVYLTKSQRWTLKVRDGSGWRAAYSTTDPDESPRLVGLGRDGRSVLYGLRDKARGEVWREARLDGGVAADPVSVLDDQSPLMDPQDGRLLGHYVLDGDIDRYTYFDPEDARVLKEVTSAYTAITVAIKSWSQDRRKVVAWVDRPNESPGYALVDLAARKSEWISAQYPALTKSDVGSKSRVRFKAADGLELTGYLTRPPGKAQAKNLPLIVLPHDGPGQRDTANFDWWAQAMASRGYATLQVNFRGSDGLGDSLRQAGQGQWGRKMQTDLSDGVRALVNGGIVDPKRVCIVGVGYGGYAALAGATIDLGVYRCAVSVAGISDLREFAAQVHSRAGVAVETTSKRIVGVEDQRTPLLAQLSPARQAGAAEIPILLIHAKDDAVVPFDQSRIMADALAKAGKPYELVVRQGSDHWLARGDTRLQTLSATVAFLERHNRPN